MLKIILFILLPFYILNANTLIIEQLQVEFHKDVIETNIFRKRFNSYLTNKCDTDIICIRRYIDLLKTWDTIKNDEALDYLLEQKSNLLKNDNLYWEKLQYKLQYKQIDFDKSQFVSVIDLEKQLFILTFWDDKTQQFYYIGDDYISSGDIEREIEIEYGDNHYLKTPAGIFKIKSGWRSDGELNKDNTTFGYGYKDRFIFYFGKQNTIRYNLFDENKEKIYDKEKWKLITDKLDFAVHAHVSYKPMGTPYSHGCVRMTDDLNKFIDNNFVFHKNSIDGENWIHKYSEQPTNPKNHKFAGEYLIIFDTI